MINLEVFRRLRWRLSRTRPPSTTAAQDEIDRLAGYAVSTGKMQGTVVVLPGSKTSMQRAAERMDNENKRK
jgi:hypothetical protein